SFQDGIAREQRKEVAKQVDRLAVLVLLRERQRFFAAALEQVGFLRRLTSGPDGCQQSLRLGTILVEKLGEDAFGLIELTTPEQDLGVTQRVAVMLFGFQLLAQGLKLGLALQAVEGTLEDALCLLELAIGDTLTYVRDCLLDFGAAEADGDFPAQVLQIA